MGTGPGVVVVGSGAAGLAAALAAADRGASVLVVERSPWVGGTTAISGGVVWAPGHRLGDPAGPPDPPGATLGYLAGLAQGDTDIGLLRAFVEDAGRVVAELQERTTLRWEVLEGWPDYHTELPGSRAGGRSIWPRPLKVGPALAARIHPVPPGTDLDVPHLHRGRPPANDGVVFRGPVRGRALVAGLLQAVLGAGVEVRTRSRATRLLLERGAVVGVEVDGEPIRARVVLASGGFQHDLLLARAFLPAAPMAPMGTPGCTGDAVRMAQAVGAALGTMQEGWWMPAILVPGERLDGADYFRPLHSERAQPGTIMVDRTGRRFVNEAQNYGDVGRSMTRFAAGPVPFPSAPSWLVFDRRARTRYPFGPIHPEGPDPDWLARATTVAGLARLISVNSFALETTIRRFNRGAAAGRDPAFGRGSLPYDRWIGDPKASHPTLAPLEEPPFYALPVHLGCLGTKGGPRTDARGRVLSVSGSPIAGLYAAGNAAASPFGTATPAGGATLGPALVFGTRAGQAAARDGQIPARGPGRLRPAARPQPATWAPTAGRPSA